MDYKELVKKLNDLEAIAYGYNINGEVIGMDCSDFEQVMVDSAEAITELLARSESAENNARLKMIENIFGKDYDLSRLRELVRADKEGKCVVLPCKVGDTVYEIEKTMCRKKILGVCDEFCMGYYDGGCWEGDRMVKEKKFNFWMIDFYGKTIFLTREAAEEALREKERCIGGLK